KADLNALQAARGASQTAATADNIQQEWFKETVGEGFRMSCLKRWGKGFSGRAPQEKATNVVQQGQFFTEKVFNADSYFFQWPIPSHELKINKNLKQNDGYDIK
ncbi:MAG: RagB/SusD family nutrient uptake outer membrane protein, partial [Bacteroidales bacterium]|nr:RagB/SusD family nutrient uptake outer membrane protein [Bacteroidales bacterium]